MNKIKTIFIGTSEFSIEILKGLQNMDLLDLQAVITQPDKPSGRKQIMTPSPVKQYLIDGASDIKVLQPENINEVSDVLKNFYVPELIIVASYGQIIPEDILYFPKYGALNVHVSLLPNLRGAVPMPMAILNGLKTTGITLQKMVYELDKGDIIAQKEIAIAEDETTESLSDKSAKAAVKMLEEDLPKWINAEITARKQHEPAATYTYREDISKEKAEIKFDTDVELAERMIRALYPWPIAWITLKNGKKLKIYKANSEDGNENREMRLEKREKRLVLKLKSGSLELLEVQLEGKNKDSGKNYLYLAEQPN